MIGRRIGFAVAAGAATATAAISAVVAAAYALYALLRDPLTPAGAAAVVALVFAVVAALLAVFMANRGGEAKTKAAHMPPSQMSMPERLIEIARGRPLMALAAIGVAGVIAIRNPMLVATLLGAVAKARGGLHHR